MHKLPQALEPFAAFNQFIIYKLTPHKTKPGKTDKLPVDHRTCQVFAKGIDWQKDSTAWTTAENALAIAVARGDNYGVGFFFTRDDPFWFIDADNCLMPDGSWSPIVLDLVGRTAGCAVEVSQSGTGLHIFGTGIVPEHACKNIAAGIELYTSGRFVALTGTRAAGNAGLSVDLTPLVAYYFQPKIATHGVTWTTKPRPEYTPFPDDEKLITKARKSKSTASKFTGRASFNDLWACNVEVLADTYTPDSNSKTPYDASSADMALASGLAFWTGGNCEHVENLMWLSGLVRDKWTVHRVYLRDTILRAVSLQANVYTLGERPRVSITLTATMAQSISNTPTLAEGFQFLAITQQLEHFKGCVYVQNSHKVFTPSGVLLKPDQFNATYGGYVFQLDDALSGKTTKKAWEAFTESQIARYPKATSTCFRPDLNAGDLINEEGLILVNTYVPIETAKQKGDPTPFLNHLAKILPDGHDQSIMIAYMAAIVQHKGVKFQWSPLIQGLEGNGKTLFTRCVAHAIGKRYTHLPRAHEISEKFNAWLFDKIFIGVEDIYVPDHKIEILEILKPMITAEDYEKRDMGVGGAMYTLCCNFIFNSNHKDAVRKTRNDRRFAIFYSAQQNDGDLGRDGMDGSYFPNLYKWLKNGGYAVVSDFLTSYVIPSELNPASECHRAPVTSSTKEAYESSLGAIEQEIQEAIDDGRPGFAGGWISSLAVMKLLTDMGIKKFAPNKRRAMLQSLGYDWHPGLSKGRTNSFINVDQGKPRLFIKTGHIHSNLQTGGEIIKAYSTAQTNTIAATTASRFKDGEK